MRVLVVLGGNAMTGPDGEASPAAQRAAIELAMEKISDLAAGSHEIAASAVRSVPLDWCGAQTQATIGLLIMNALEAVLARHGLSRRVATLVTRTLVDPDDPGFGHPVKPIGRYLLEARGKLNDCGGASLGEPWRTGVAASGCRSAATPRA
jgi:carbamate kinase